MKITYFILILLQTLIIKTNAQWEQVSNNLYGADVSCLVNTDSNIYAGTYNGGIVMSKNKVENCENIS